MTDTSRIATAVDASCVTFNQDAINRIFCKIAEGRKIIILGANWKSIVFRGRYDIGVSYYAVSDYSEQKYGKTYDNIEIRNIYDIAYEKPGSVYVIVSDMHSEASVIEKLLLGLGLSNGNDFCIIDDLNAQASIVDDAHLHYSMVFELPGVKIFGNAEDKNAFRIVTLGGSTTDAATNLYSGASWPQHLFDILQRSRFPSVVFNCGIVAYASPREFIKLCRDGLTLSPDLVISYSGVNDTLPDLEFFTNRHKRPWIDHWTETQSRTAGNHLNGKMVYGLQRNMTHAEVWVQHLRMMHGVCNEFNIKFAGFFQSFWGTNGSLSEYEIKIRKLREFERYSSSSFLRANNARYQNPDLILEYIDSVSALIRDIPYIFDKHTIYKDNTELLYDFCHTSDAGNHLIAQHIFKTLLENGYLSGRHVE